MSATKYMLVSLPTSISSTREDAINALKATVAGDGVNLIPFKIPEFKIGTLDALVQQADDLAKLEASCEAVVAKVGDSLRSLLEGDEDKIAQQKTVNDSRFTSPAFLYIIQRDPSTDISQSLLTSICEPSPGIESSIAQISHLQS
jgi:V-ATPase subunit C